MIGGISLAPPNWLDKLEDIHASHHVFYVNIRRSNVANLTDVNFDFYYSLVPPSCCCTCEAQ